MLIDNLPKRKFIFALKEGIKGSKRILSNFIILHTTPRTTSDLFDSNLGFSHGASS
jgi:hypothetical protein